MHELVIAEIVLVLGLIVTQSLHAFKTLNLIKKLKYLVPSGDIFRLKQYEFPKDVLTESSPQSLLNDLIYYSSDEDEKRDTEDENRNEEEDLFSNSTQISHGIKCSLIVTNQEISKVFNSILTYINVYLLRNTGSASDFNLIKDIIERNVDTEQEAIDHRLTVPLYLGLIGTMVGIVFGLIHLYLIFRDEGIDNLNMEPFLLAVAIAMAASLWGLSCTIINSSFIFKEARWNLEKSKNEFYTFIQTDLLPVVNQSVSSSVHHLNQNLIRFNEEFADNLKDLGGMLNKNHDALIAQEKIITELERIDITSFAKANVQVLKELKVSTTQLEKFNEYLTNLGKMVDHTNKLTRSFDSVLSKTDSFKELASKLDSRVDESNKLMTFLSDHFSQLEVRSTYIQDSLRGVDDVLMRSLKELEEHTRVKIEAIKEITIKEEDLMTRAFADNRSNISKLSLLEDVNEQITQIKESSASQIERLKNELHDLNETFSKTNVVLEKIKNNSLFQKTQNMTDAIKKMFD